MKLRFVFASLLIFGCIACENVNTNDSIEDPRDAIVGAWNQFEVVGESPFEVTIQKDVKTKDGIIILGFNTMPSLHAILAGGKITIPRQTVNSGFGTSEILEGEGIINGVLTRIEFKYKNDNVPGYSFMVPFKPSSQVASTY